MAILHETTHRRREKRVRGFTLIELMVVISVIGVLSSMVLAATYQARVKAHNSLVNQTVEQYRLALELYKSSNNTYPILADTNWHCLGTGYPGNVCGYIDTGPNTDSPALDADLGQYIKQMAAVSVTPLPFGIACSPQDIADWGCVSSTSRYVGMSYACTAVQNAVCTKATIVWMLDGNETCPINGTETFFGVSTLCVLKLGNAG